MTVDINRTIAGNINSELKKHGKMQTELASHLGYSKQIVSKMLKGERTISAVELKAISEFVDVSVNTLLKTSEPAAPFREELSEKLDEKKNSGLVTFIDRLSEMIVFNTRTRMKGLEGRQVWL
jgi:transcriptional regulator with XRE-family HTH domain